MTEVLCTNRADRMLRSQSWPSLEREKVSVEEEDRILVSQPPSHHLWRGLASVRVNNRHGIFYSLDEADPHPRPQREATTG